jgi:hypothetical protein
MHGCPYCTGSTGFLNVNEALIFNRLLKTYPYLRTQGGFYVHAHQLREQVPHYTGTGERPPPTRFTAVVVGYLRGAQCVMFRGMRQQGKAEEEEVVVGGGHR